VPTVVALYCFNRLPAKLTTWQLYVKRTSFFDDIRQLTSLHTLCRKYVYHKCAAITFCFVRLLNSQTFCNVCLSVAVVAVACDSRIACFLPQGMCNHAQLFCFSLPPAWFIRRLFIYVCFNPLAYAAACDAVWATDVFAFSSSFLSVDGMTCHISF
jgi:hypothetical protein